MFFFRNKKKDEIFFLKKAIARTEVKIAEIWAKFDPTQDCCPTCMSAGYDLKLDTKLARQVSRLRVLLIRKDRWEEVIQLEKKYGKDNIDQWQKYS